MMTNAEIATVVAWHQALNAGDVNGLVALSSADVEVGGPRGAGRGVPLLREWCGRAGIRLEPRHMFHRGSTVVVEQDAEWRAPDSGDVTGRQVLASVFRVADGRVTSVIRFPDLVSALAATGLTVADRV
jgi:ketosteroid isomerase-like protein